MSKSNDEKLKALYAKAALTSLWILDNPDVDTSPASKQPTKPTSSEQPSKDQEPTPMPQEHVQPRTIMLPKQYVSVTGATEDEVLAAFFKEMRSRPGKKRIPLWGPQHKGLRPLPGTKSSPATSQKPTPKPDSK